MTHELFLVDSLFNITEVDDSVHGCFGDLVHFYVS